MLKLIGNGMKNIRKNIFICRKIEEIKNLINF